jgi:hypothetical protein
MLPKLLTETVMHPLPWRIDPETWTAKDRDGYSIGVGGREPDWQAFNDYFGKLQELLKRVEEVSDKWFDGSLVDTQEGCLRQLCASFVELEDLAQAGSLGEDPDEPGASEGSESP